MIRSTFVKSLKQLKRITLKYKKIVISILVFWAFWFFGLGALSGWLLSKASLEKFPEFKKDDRLLVIAPHIDDEIICCSGLIQRAKQAGSTVKIVYLTNGDDNLGSVIRDEKTLKINPNDFITLGEKRATEGKKATQVLGLAEKDLIFLAYAERGLYQMLNKHYDLDNPYTSQGTKFTYNPYSGTYKSQQLYTGSNLVSDLGEVIKNYQPTLITISHLRDLNSDHRAAFSFLEKVLTEEKIQTRVFAYLVHYRFFPAKKTLSLNEFLYPPKKLFSQKGWFSFDLTTEEENKKLEAINQNVSQRELRPFYDLLQSFVKRNEIFEEIY